MEVGRNSIGLDEELLGMGFYIFLNPRCLRPMAMNGVVAFDEFDGGAKSGIRIGQDTGREEQPGYRVCRVRRMLQGKVFKHFLTPAIQARVIIIQHMAYGVISEGGPIFYDFLFPREKLLS